MLLTTLVADPGRGRHLERAAEDPLTKPEDLLARTAPAPGGYIVQLKNDVPLGRRLGKRSSHQQFHKRASLGLDYSVRTEFTNDKLFYGLSIQLHENKTTAEVRNILTDIPEVQAVWPINMVPKPSPGPGAGNFSASSASARKSAGASGQWAPTDDSPVLPAISGANVDSTHKMADVDKLHAQGIKGKGIKIGIIDTGEWFPHLARAFFRPLVHYREWESTHRNHCPSNQILRSA